MKSGTTRADHGADRFLVMPIRGFTTKGASHYIGTSENFLKKARRKPIPGETRTPGPVFTRIGSKVIYLKEDLDAYLDEAARVFSSGFRKGFFIGVALVEASRAYWTSAFKWLGHCGTLTLKTSFTRTLNQRT